MTETPEQRRQAQIGAVGSVKQWSGLNPYALQLDALLAHFENTGQRHVADAIRFGVSRHHCRKSGLTTTDARVEPMPIVVNYPEHGVSAEEIEKAGE